MARLHWHLHCYGPCINGARRLRPSSLKRLILFVVAAALAVLVVHGLLGLLSTDLMQQAEVGLCPACYGRSLCGHLDYVSLVGWEKFHHVNSLMNVKNVLFAQLGQRMVVLKKLGHDAELLAADKLICAENISRHTCSVISDCGPTALPPGCSVPASANKLAERVTSLTPELVRGLAPMTYCPTQRLLRRMAEKYVEHWPGAPDLRSDEVMTMLYTLMVNEEPLILQTFPASEGWPFPVYFGACGRLTAQSYGGRTVADLFNADWQTRVDIAWQIMKIADQFTENASGFRLFWTDLDLSNLAVDDAGHVVVVDAEDIYVVDVQQIFEAKPPGWVTPHYHLHEECAESASCLRFNPDMFCTRADSDFNYYTACRALSHYGVDAYDHRGGLLHDPPPDVDAHDLRLLKFLLEECVKPTRTFARMYAKEQLLLLLSEMAGRSS